MYSWRGSYPIEVIQSKPAPEVEQSVSFKPKSLRLESDSSKVVHIDTSLTGALQGRSLDLARSSERPCSAPVREVSMWTTLDESDSSLRLLGLKLTLCSTSGAGFDCITSIG